MYMCIYVVNKEEEMGRGRCVNGMLIYEEKADKKGISMIENRIIIFMCKNIERRLL